MGDKTPVLGAAKWPMIYASQAGARSSWSTFLATALKRMWAIMLINNY